MASHGFAAYQMWVAIKTHFNNPTFDYHRYGGKTQVKEEHFEKLNYKKIFYALDNKYRNNLEDFYLSVFARDGNKSIFIAKTMGEEFQREHQDRLRRIQAFTAEFETDVKIISDVMENREIPFKRVLKSDTKLPPIVQLEIKGHICPETLIVIDLATGFLNRECSNPLWADTVFRLQKYAKFMRYTDEQMKKFLAIMKQEIRNDK